MLSRIVTRAVRPAAVVRQSTTALCAVPTRAMATRALPRIDYEKPEIDENERLLRWSAIAAVMTGVMGYYIWGVDTVKAEHPATAMQKVNYDQVRQEIADILDKEDYDDGSLGPLFVRLAWHSSGSYSQADGNGGSNGAHIRYGPQKFWGGNAGINVAIDELEVVKKKHPGISYGDLYTLCGVVAVEEMGGPVIPWRPGRLDHEDKDENHGKSPQQDNRLPDASQGQKHLRDVFYRMGFNDREIVALSGAHALGRCHRDRSGFDGPWTRAPTTMSNQYFILLRDEEWTERKWDGPRQFTNSKSGNDLMMLPTDIALLQDKSMKEWVMKYADNEEMFFNDFSAAFSKLLELGVSFHASESKAWYNKLFG